MSDNTCDPKTCGSDCGECSAAAPAQPTDDEIILKERLSRIRHKILVFSGKGGVGKSTVAVNLAVSLSLSGKKVGLLDIDFHGPSVPVMLNQRDATLQNDGETILPLEIGGLKVVSIGFLLQDNDAAVIWRGPMKMGVIRQFLKDVAWGDLDYLIIDSPPGTGDEPLSVCQLIEDASGAVLVTTPQDVSVADVRRSVSFCHQLKLPVLGVIENMSGFVCPKCGEVTDIFGANGGEAMAKDMGIPFLGKVPLDPQLVRAGDDGTPFVHKYGASETAKAFATIVEPLLKMSETKTEAKPEAKAGSQTQGDGSMRIAIPTAEGKLCLHFGHCQVFAMLDVDEATKTVTKREDLTPPPHEPGVLPRWLHEQGATMIIAAGMGSRAQSLFAEQGITVQVGAPSETPETVVESYLNGTLAKGDNICDH